MNMNIFDKTINIPILLLVILIICSAMVGMSFSRILVYIDEERAAQEAEELKEKQEHESAIRSQFTEVDALVVKEIASDIKASYEQLRFVCKEYPADYHNEAFMSHLRSWHAQRNRLSAYCENKYCWGPLFRDATGL